MAIFRFEREQKVYDIYGMKVGGQPGERPPLLIANMFQTKDKLVESRKPVKFDKIQAADRIKELEEISLETGIPTLVGLVAPTGDEMKAYTEFFLSVPNNLPFGIDSWTEKSRREAAQFIASIGMQDRFNYNSITAWDPDIPDQVAMLKECGIKHIILQPFDMEDKHATGRMKSLDQMLEVVEPAGFHSILVDTTAMNLPTHGICLMANRMVKEELGYPAGNAPANGSYMWRAALEKWGADAFRGMDAGMHALSAVLWQDWMVYGPMSGTRRIFAAVAAATAILTCMAWEEGAELPADPRHPLNLHFPQEVAMMRGMVEGKSDRAYKRQKELKSKQQAAANVATTA
jgi:tetrahydromethanopterin S-methyltransferase subunit H